MKRALHLVFGGNTPSELESLSEGDRVEILAESPPGTEAERARTAEEVVRLMFEHDVVVTW